MATGDSADLLSRVKRLLPTHWFNQAAPIRDAIMGGLSDLAAWCYSLTAYVKQQSRIATATGPWLDLIAYDFLGLYLRRNGATDDVFRAKIQATILQERVTRAGMVSMLKNLTGQAPTIFEPWNTGDTGGWDTGGLAWAGAALGTQPGGGWDTNAAGWSDNAWGWDLTTSSFEASSGAGGWGDMSMPAQVLITVPPVINQGVPQVGGWDSDDAAWDGGVTEWVDDDMTGQGSLSEDDIYAAIVATKPTGVVAWTQLQ